jgi:hypothetical protein
MVVATTSAAEVTTAEVMNAGPADPIRTLVTLTILAGAFMLLATALGFARLMWLVSASVMASQRSFAKLGPEGRTTIAAARRRGYPVTWWRVTGGR